MAYLEDNYRRCQFCKRSSVVYRDGFYELVKYSVRHYAHPTCLAERNGTEGAKLMVPEHQRRSIEVAMLDANDWTRQMAEHVDRRAGRVSSEPMPKKSSGEPGRPPRDGKKAAGQFNMRVTERELRAWAKAAGDLSVSAWIRALANKAAGVDVPSGAEPKEE